MQIEFKSGLILYTSGFQSLLPLLWCLVLPRPPPKLTDDFSELPSLRLLLVLVCASCRWNGQCQGDYRPPIMMNELCEIRTSGTVNCSPVARAFQCKKSNTAWRNLVVQKSKCYPGKPDVSKIYYGAWYTKECFPFAEFMRVRSLKDHVARRGW